MLVLQPDIIRSVSAVLHHDIIRSVSASITN